MSPFVPFPSRTEASFHPLHRCWGLALALALLLTPWLGAELLAQTGTISPEEVHRGMKGYGLTVMVGQEPERFEVEVIGVVRNEKPDASSILVRLSGLDLEESGVIAGMSGSPVYLDDRLAGAVAYGWQFAQQPLAGITPIAAMEELMVVDEALTAEARGESAEAGLSGSSRSLSQRSSPPPRRAAGWSEMPSLQDFLREGRGDLPWRELLQESLAQLAGPSPQQGASTALVWGADGFGPQGRALLSAGLGSVAELGRGISAPLAAGSSTSSQGEEPAELGPGSPVSAVLLHGDLSFAASGTVTDRRGDNLLAFGHPFLGFGPYRIPMATAEVVTVIPSLNNSFKVSNVGELVGTFREDRTPGIFGIVGETARTIPFTVRFGGIGTAVGQGGGEKFHMQVADLPVMLPTLLAVGALGVLDVDAHSSGPQSLEMEARLELDQWGEIALRQTFDGPNAGNDLVSYLLIVANLLLQSPLEDVRLNEVSVDVQRGPANLTLDVIDVHADRTVVAPGAEVRLFVDLRGRDGRRHREEMLFQVPATAPDGRYSLLVGDGVSADSARFTVAPVAPTRFEHQLEVLRSLSSSRELVVLGLVGERGLAVDGTVMPRLPGSVASLWAPREGAAAQPLSLAIDQIERRSLDRPINGIGRVDLTVRRSAAAGVSR
ncbi:MAG: SpoIVB peptidase S55 domain-containing protein [Acidobacteriota bacterium]